MTDSSSPGRIMKVSRELLDDDCAEQNAGEGSRSTKATRHDIEVPLSEVDIKLAEKLDNILRISDTRRPRFFLHKPKQQPGDIGASVRAKETSPLKDIDKSKLKPKNLTKEELRERLLKKYETLVPELDPNRPTVKLIKVLSAKESLELARGEAKRQMEHQLELSSVGGNRQALAKGIGAFRLNDGYEMPAKCFLPGKKTSLMARKTEQSKSSDPSSGQVDSNKSSKSVKFSDRNETFNVSRHGAYGYFGVDDESDEDEEDEDDDLDDDDDNSECSTTVGENAEKDDATDREKD